MTELLYNQALNWTSAYQSQNILVFVGDDFTLSSAERTFGSLDMLISHTKTHSRFDLDIKYSTISEYFETIKAEKSIYQKYTHDFFPYADHPYSYWSGYFSSRPSLKLQIKKFADFVRATERLVTHHALYNYQNITEEEIS